MKIIDLDAEVSAQKIMVLLIFEIDGNSIHIEMALIDQDTMVLFQIIILGFKICYLKTIVFLLICDLVDNIIKDKYPWIIY